MQACGISVPRPGIEPVPPAVEAQTLNHWTAREVPNVTVLEVPCPMAAAHFTWSTLLDPEQFLGRD